jgi:hypothetical protein
MMFTKMFQDNTNLDGLEEAIDKLLIKINNTPVDSEDYPKLTKQLKELYECKAKETPKRISPETLFSVGASLIGIFAVLEYEHGRVITSKAFGMVPRFFR